MLVDGGELVVSERRASAAATFSSSWAMLDAPTSAEVTRRSRSTQEIAI